MLINLSFPLVNLLLQGLSQELREGWREIYFSSPTRPTVQGTRREGAEENEMPDWRTADTGSWGELVCFLCGDLGLRPGYERPAANS